MFNTLNAGDSDRRLQLQGKLFRHRGYLINGWVSPLNKPFYEVAHAAYQKLVARHPDNIEHTIDLAAMNSDLAEFLPGLDQRIAKLRDSVVMVRSAAARDPQNPWAQMNVFLQLSTMGSFYRRAGRLAPALPYVRESIEPLRRSVELDPADAGARGMYAFALGDLAALEAVAGDRQKAEIAARQAIPLAAAMLTNNPSLFRPNWGLAHAYNALGLLRIGDCRANYRKAVDHARTANSSSGGRNIAVKTLIVELEQALARCPS
jgi:tetratricopeptide (TPR) repeat protein